MDPRPVSDRAEATEEEEEAMSTAQASRYVTRLTGVTYDMYVALRNARGNGGLRMTYHDGVLEIMSPEFRHEKHGRLLGFLVCEYAVALDLPCQTAGSTTFRKGLPRERKGQGKEPDESFYLGDAEALVRDKDTLDLEVDPPPSLWIEVDNRVSSQGRLPLYAKLGIPEVWQYRPRSRRLRFGRLVGDGYEELHESLALPGFTPGRVLDLLAEVATRGQTAGLRWLRDVWFPEHLQELRDRRAGGRG
jgi:Uma2 family endonuclease